MKYINNKILTAATKLTYTVKDLAPSRENELFSSTGLVIWSGASDNTIYNCPKVNHAFRAIHDATHLETGLGFSPAHEIEMGRIQAAKLASRCESLMADVFYIEIALQAEHYLKTGKFVDDQVQFFLKNIKVSR